MKIGQVPFLPFISSSSVLLQLSVEPCQTEERERGKKRGKKGEEKKQTHDNSFVNVIVSDGRDASDTLRVRRTDDLTNRWKGEQLPPRSTNQPGQQCREPRISGDSVCESV